MQEFRAIKISIFISTSLPPSFYPIISFPFIFFLFRLCSHSPWTRSPAHFFLYTSLHFYHLFSSLFFIHHFFTLFLRLYFSLFHQSSTFTCLHLFLFPFRVPPTHSLNTRQPLSCMPGWEHSPITRPPFVSWKASITWVRERIHSWQMGFVSPFKGGNESLLGISTNRFCPLLPSFSSLFFFLFSLRG